MNLINDVLDMSRIESDRQNAIEAGMNGHLAKPIDVGELLRVVGTARK